MNEYDGKKAIEVFAQTFLRGFLKSRDTTHLDAVRMALHAFNFQNRIFDQIPNSMEIIQDNFNKLSDEEQRLVFQCSKFMEEMEHEFYKAMENEINKRTRIGDG